MTGDVTIERYRPEFRAAFEALNREWLESHDLLESHDVSVLQEPERYFLDPGGEVFVASSSGVVLGTVAIVPESAGRFELAKLSVDPTARGRGIGRTLATAAIEFARSHGAREIVLSSNSALQAAIRLYESLGFRHVPLPSDVKYVTADVYMALSL